MTAQEDFIRVLRSTGLTQVEMAQALGISQPFLNRVLNGRVRITEHMALAVEHAWGKPGMAKKWITLQALERLEAAREK